MLSFVNIKSICDDELKKNSNILFCSVFGSYSENKQNDNSDVDIAVFEKQKLSGSEKLNISLNLSDKFNKKVDLVDLHSVSGTILHQALVNGKLVFVKDKILYAEIIKKMLFNQADMMPNYNMILKNRREEFLYE